MRRREAHSRRRAGLTLAELLIGLLVTSLVASAVSAVMVSVGAGWRTGESSVSSSASTGQAMARLQRILRTARQIGAVRAGGLTGGTQDAAVALWKQDANGDGRIQFSELALIEHSLGADPLESVLRMYDVSFPSTMTLAQKQAADATLVDDCIYDANQITTFKSMTYVRSTVLAGRVMAAQFRRIDGAATVRPRLEYALRFDEGGESVTKYGTTALRTPATLPVSQR